MYPDLGAIAAPSMFPGYSSGDPVDSRSALDTSAHVYEHELLPMHKPALMPTSMSTLIPTPTHMHTPTTMSTPHIYVARMVQIILTHPPILPVNRLTPAPKQCPYPVLPALRSQWRIASSPIFKPRQAIVSWGDSQSGLVLRTVIVVSHRFTTNKQTNKQTNKWPGSLVRPLHPRL